MANPRLADPRCAVCGHLKSYHIGDSGIRPCARLIHVEGQGYRCTCIDFHPIMPTNRAGIVEFHRVYGLTPDTRKAGVELCNHCGHRFGDHPLGICYGFEPSGTYESTHEDGPPISVQRPNNSTGETK